MDREIPKEVRNKERNKKIIRYGGHRRGKCNRYQRTHLIYAYGSEDKRSGVFYG